MSVKYGREWKRLRDKYVKYHPYCERCLANGIQTPVEEVHHILPIYKGGKNNPENLMSVCKKCHIQIHIELGDRNE